MSLFEILFLIVCWPFAPDHLPDAADADTWTNLKEAARLLDLWEGGSWGDERGNFGFADDLRWCWITHGRLADAPPSADRHRWPADHECQAALAFADDHIRWLEGIEAWHLLKNAEQMPNVVTDALGEARTCRYAWYCLLAVQHRYPGYNSQPCAVRDQLRCLRATIGDDAYYSGRMPPWVPIERFAWIR